MKRALAVLALGMPGCLIAGGLSVHTVMLCPGGCPDISVYFEQVSGSGQMSQDSRFEHVANTHVSTSRELAFWKAGLESIQGLTLTVQDGVADPAGRMRQNQVDGQGHIRRVIWISSQGLRTESALFDENGHVLRFDRWNNQAVFADTALKPLVPVSCVERALPIRILSDASGNVESEIKELEGLSDLVTDYALAHDLGLTATAGSPGVVPVVARKGLAVEAAIIPEIIGPKGSGSVPLNQPLVVVPNPARGNAIVFYRLQGDFNGVQIFVYDLAGRKQREYAQGCQAVGIHQASVNFGGLSKGVYFALLLGDQGAGATVLGRFKFAFLP